MRRRLLQGLFFIALAAFAAAPAQVAALDRIDAIALLPQTNENFFSSAVIDPAGEFAYFGTHTSPGRVVKIDLATFERVGAIELESGESLLSSAVIDPAGAFAYFGTDTFPGRVVKIDLATFTRVGAIELEFPEVELRSAVIDPAGAFAYFGTSSTFTLQGRVVKIDLTTFERVGAIELEIGEDLLSSAVIDPAGEFAYFGTFGLSDDPAVDPGRVVKIDLVSFERVGAITLESGEDLLSSAVIDPAGEFAYFGTFGIIEDINEPSRVVKIDLETFERVGAIELDPGVPPPFFFPEEKFLESAVIDPAGEFAYFRESRGGRVVKIDLETFERVGAIGLGICGEAPEGIPRSAVIDPAGGFAYFGTATGPGEVVKIDLAAFALDDKIVMQPKGENRLHSAVIDPAGEFSYYGTFELCPPSQVVKIDHATFERVGAIELESDELGLSSAVIDPAGAFAYFGTGTFPFPGRVVKIDLDTFERVGAIMLESGELGLSSAVIDPAGGFAYFGTSTSPGRVVKIDLATFERVGAITLESGENNLISVVIDPAGGFAYFGTITSPARVVKIDLATFERVGAIMLESGENRLDSAVIDPDGAFAYFGTGTVPGQVVKINLATFERVGAIELESGEDRLESAVIDPAGAFAYFGTGTFAGLARVAKIDLCTFERVNAIELESGESFLSSAVIDPAGQFAYFGTSTSPGQVVQIGLVALLSDPGCLDFGDVEVGVTSPAQTVTIENTGDAEVVIGALGISGAAADDYALVNDACSGQTLTPSSTCTFELGFTPSATGARSAQVEIPSDSSSSPVAVSLSGNGMQALVSIDPAALDFGDVEIGVTSPAQTVTIENTGDADLVLGALGISGPADGDYAINDSCSNQTVEPSATCTFDVSFTPSATGTRTAQVDIPSNAPSSPDAVALTGNGVDPSQSQLSLSTGSLDFGDVEVGVTSPAQTVTIENTGGADLVFGTLAISGPAAGDYAINDSCSNQTVEPSATCAFEVSFTPSATGARAAQVDIPSNAESSPDTVSLTGNGVQPQPALILDPAAVNFGFVAPGDSATATVTATNSGSADLTIDNISDPDESFAITGGSCTPVPVTLAPAESCEIEVEFAPDEEGSFASSFEIESNAPSSPDTVNLSGTSTVEIVPIPALNRWSLALLGGLLLLLAGSHYRRRRVCVD